MKFLTTLTLLTLSIGNVFAKGGDYPTVDDLDIVNRLKYFNQIQVVLEETNNRHEYSESKEDFILFLMKLKNKYNFAVKKITSDNTTHFCIKLSKTQEKHTITNQLSEELKLFPISVNTSINSSLRKSCESL